MALCTCCQLIATITDVLNLTMLIDAPGTIRNCGVVYSIAEKVINQLASYFYFFHSEKTVINVLPALQQRKQ